MPLTNCCSDARLTRRRRVLARPTGGRRQRSDIARRIAGSNENNLQLINDDYLRYLGRAADAGGLAYWLKQFAAGKTNEDVIAGFTGSQSITGGTRREPPLTSNREI